MRLCNGIATVLLLLSSVEAQDVIGEDQVLLCRIRARPIPGESMVNTA
jgi:hypothetical protein